MIKVPTVKAVDLFEFARREIATNIERLIFQGDADNDRRHSRWFTHSCFLVGRDEFNVEHPERLDWAWPVAFMVLKFMQIHDVEVLLIVMDESVLLINPWRE